MVINKNDKAKVILTALYNKKELVKDEGIYTKRINKLVKLSAIELNDEYLKAVVILQDRMRNDLKEEK